MRSWLPRPAVRWAVVPSLCLLLPAQGVVNATLLAPAADAGAALALRLEGPAGVVAQARPAVVQVLVEVDGPRGKFVIERPSSGVVVDGSGLVLTFAHLVAEVAGASDKRLFVQRDDAERTRLPATVLRTDAATGLALLQVATPAGGLPQVELATDPPRAGQPVVVLALPAGKDLLAFAGVLSPALAPVSLRGQVQPPGSVWLSDARNDERCDGGPVVDAAGRLVGLYSAEHVRRDVAEPTLDDLRAPSFGAILPVAAARRAFAAEFAAAGRQNPTLRAAAGGPDAPIDAVARIAPAVVGVFGGDGPWPVPEPRDPGAVQRRPGLGSGVVLAPGLVVTNAHLCAKDAVRVRAGGRELAATVVARQTDANLALLRLAEPVELGIAACHADGDVVLGETVYAVGAPFGGPCVVTAGVLSAVRGGGRLQADPNLGNQNGGGAVVDAAGRLLGIADGGAVDPLEVAFAQRGDRATTETNLSTFVGVQRLRRAFAKELAELAPAEASIRQNQPAAAERAQRDSALTRMVAATAGAMLNIYVSRTMAPADESANPFAAAAEPAPALPLSLGSGVIIDRTGLAISNWHVVDDATNPDGSMRPDYVVQARVFGGKTYRVEVLSISREDDLSLLRLQLEPGETVDAVAFGSSDDLRIGERVAAIGNPHGAANTITFGVVTAKDQELRVRGRWAKLEHLIETDAAINGGNSGGALLDMHGRLVGINSAGGGTFNNRGYAIAVDHVRRQVLGLLLQAYKLRSPELGLRVIDDGGQVVVMDVDPRGPAATARLRSGDRITSLAGTPITWSPGFALLLREQPAEQPLELVVDRQGQRQAATLAPLPPSVWAVVRQSGLECRTVPFQADPERLRRAAIALHRRFTGDPTAEPSEIPEQAVRVERVHPGQQPEGTDVAAGDLILAVQFQDAATGEKVLVRLASVDGLKDLFNDRRLGTYEGQQFTCWVERDGAIREVEITAKRLFW